MLKNPRLLLVSFIACVVAFSAAPSRADDDDWNRDGDHEHRDRDDDDHEDRDDDDGDDEDCDGQCDRDRDDCHRHRKHKKHRFHVINLAHGLILTPTTNAPAGAKGKVQFIVVNDNGTNYEMLFVKAINLTNGAYTVEVTDDSTNAYNLGTLNVATKTNLDAGQHFNRYCTPWGGRTNDPSLGYVKWVREIARKKARWINLMRLSACTNLVTFATNAYCWHTNTLTVGSGSFLLPGGISHSNATIITVSDSSDAVVLTGDFTTATNATVTYKEIASIIPGTATNAQGSATITYRLARNKAVGTFKLQATGLPPKERLYLTADGTNTIKVCTGGQSALTVRSFRRLDVANLQSIVATDRSSNVVFSVNF